MKKLTRKKIRWSIALLLLAVILGIALYPLPDQLPIRYFDRTTGQLKTEKVSGEKWLVWLYNNRGGEVTMKTLARRKALSSMYGKRMDRPASAKMIAPFIRDFNVDMSIAQKQKFENFNDFFTRKLKPGARPIDSNPNSVVSPADGKILAYANVSAADFFVKGSRFDVFSFLEDEKLAEKYRHGSLIIVRLAPPDYHRFHFPASGTVSPNTQIKGDYYSVSPLALRRKAEIFWQNKREYTLLSTAQFGDIVITEVGATLVGTIIQTYSGNQVEKGQEKGYFKFGGSTVVLLFEKGKVKIDADLLRNTAKGYETAVKMGEHIAEKPVGSAQ